MIKVLNTMAQWVKHQTKFVAALVVAAVVGGAGSAIVMASVPDGTGVIHSCYKNGALQNTFRVIDSATTNCNANETALTWNQKGVKGDTGAAGAIGPQGPQGPAGTGNGGYNTADKILTLNWGDIPAGGTQQAIFTVAGFGNYFATLCDSSGNFDYSFQNTSGQTLGYPGGTLAPGQVINNSDIDGIPSVFWIGNGPTSSLENSTVQPNTIADAQTCQFLGFVR